MRPWRTPYYSNSRCHRQCRLADTANMLRLRLVGGRGVLTVRFNGAHYISTAVVVAAALRGRSSLFCRDERCACCEEWLGDGLPPVMAAKFFEPEVDTLLRLQKRTAATGACRSMSAMHGSCAMAPVSSKPAVHWCRTVAMPPPVFFLSWLTPGLTFFRNAVAPSGSITARSTPMMGRISSLGPASSGRFPT